MKKRICGFGNKLMKCWRKSLNFRIVNLDDEKDEPKNIEWNIRGLHVCLY